MIFLDLILGFRRPVSIILVGALFGIGCETVIKFNATYFSTFRLTQNSPTKSSDTLFLIFFMIQ
jgi:hypothetical protein